MTEGTATRFCWYGAGAQVAVDVGRQLTAHVTGIKRCGSPWCCPMCAPVVRERRANEIDRALGNALDRGWTVLFLTLTVRHHQGDELGPRINLMAKAVHEMMQGRPWQKRRDRWGYVGSVRAVEVTWGEANGWHPHVHTAIVFRGALDDVDLAVFRSWCEGRWASVVKRMGFGTVNEHGVDLRRVTTAADLGTYLCKIEGGWSAGHELARGDTKSSAGRVTPFGMLERVLEDGEARWALLWREYERATHGRRAIVMSKGLRAELLPDVDDQTDEELAAAEGADVTLLRAMIDRAIWNRRVDESTVGDLLTEVECVSAVLLTMCDMAGCDPPALNAAGESGQGWGPPEA